jgi:hypothetical protein
MASNMRTIFGMSYKAGSHLITSDTNPDSQPCSQVTVYGQGCVFNNKRTKVAPYKEALLNGEAKNVPKITHVEEKTI